MRLALSLLLVLLAAPAAAQELPSIDQELPSIEAKTEGLERRDGLLPVYWDARTGTVWLEIPRLDEEVLYQVSLPAGLGSNDVGLDRGQLGDTKVVRFERVGPKVLLVEPNLRFRADSENAAEVRAVEDAFASSVVWGFTAAAETDGRVLVDATDFVVRDAHGVVRSLRGSGQGSFRLDAGRSAPVPDVLRAFPRNTELEARLTFTSDDPGRYVRDVAADPYAVTVRVRHSFVALPPPGFTPRPFDPRSGFFGVSWADYAAPIGEELEQRYIARHRLEKADPAAPVSPPVEPIVYYLDPGTPEPVRSALLDGARWWDDAFRAAGFVGAFRVEVLPDSADPLDARYNMIQWVHRATRGWSYGASITDPRTGEIIKGHVTLGSLRVRQDYLLAEGLLSPYDAPATAAGLPPEEDPMLAMALARLRQLSAHEVGHTLGLAHNFAASANDRASVMDYPAPLATLDAEGEVSLADAYDTGIGLWDALAVRYGYGEWGVGPAPADSLQQVLTAMQQARLYYITDADARPAGGAHPLGHLWDNGSEPVTTLDREMAVREAALADFGIGSIREGRPFATLEEVLVPLYLRHRYAVEAAAKLVGGVEYSYALRGDARPLPSAVPAPAQRAALDALLRTVQPAALRLPPNVRTAIPPRPPGYGATRELFDGDTGPTFDPYAPAEAASALVFDLLANPDRAARLVYQADFAPDLPDLTYVLERTTSAVWEADVPDDPYDAELQRITQTVWTDALLDLLRRRDLAPAARARTLRHLRGLHAWLSETPGDRRDAETQAHRLLAYDDLDRYLFRLYTPEERRLDPTLPPGSPIGAGDGPAARHARRRALLEATATSCSWMPPGP